LSPEELKDVPKMPGSLDEALDCLRKDHKFLFKGDVFTEDVIDTWINPQDGEGSEPGAAAASPHGVRALLRHLRFAGGTRAGRLDPPDRAARFALARVTGTSPVLGIGYDAADHLWIWWSEAGGGTGPPGWPPSVPGLETGSPSGFAASTEIRPQNGASRGVLGPGGPA
jgi:hypothetical protein